jgi:uncharacterized membrane protein YphA (DoxX/SURF4 family)
MATSTTAIPPSVIETNEHHVVQTVQLTLRVLYGLVPIVAGLDKFTNWLADWSAYLNPLVLRIIPLTDVAFMHIVGVIEIIAGALVLAKPRLGGGVVTAWLIAIALQLILWGRYYDIAVRDIVMALGGALSLVRLTPFAESRQLA